MTMRVRKADGTWKQLEWWKYRHGARVAPLWYQTPGQQAVPHKIIAKPDPGKIAPCKATNEWIAMKKTYVSISDEKWDEYKRYCLRDSYSKLYHLTRSQTHREYAMNVWEERVNKVPWHALGKIYIDEPDHAKVQKLAVAHKTDRRPTTLSEIAARLQLDETLLTMAGGIGAVMQKLPPKMMARFENLTEPRVPLPEYWKIDKSLQSWLSFIYSPAVTIPTDQTSKLKHIRIVKKVWDDICENISTITEKPTYIFILAANSAGKTTYVAKHQDSVDGDTMLNQVGILKALGSYSKIMDLEVDTMHRQLIHQKIMTSRQRTICTQISPRILVGDHTMRPFSVLLVVVDIPTRLLEDRMMLRGWDRAKIARRLARWRKTVEDVTNNKCGLSEAENEKIIFRNSFPK